MHGFLDGALHEVEAWRGDRDGGCPVASTRLALEVARLNRVVFTVGGRSKALQQLRAAGIEVEEVINAAGLVAAAGPSFHRAIRSL